jgi:hypothetical protein
MRLDCDFYYVVSSTYVGDRHGTTKKVYSIEALANLAAETKITMRKHLNADAMFDAIRQDFAKVADHRANNSKIPLVDVLMKRLKGSE